MSYLPLFLCDFYKVGHHMMYAEGTELIYSNFTPRGSRISGIESVVCFGVQYLVKEYLTRQFNQEFFLKPKEEVISAYKHRMDTSLGPDAVNTKHLEALHDLGYLPLEVKALPEGSSVPFKTPMLTIKNTHPDFFWLPNYLETLISAVLWHPTTSATTAREYRKVLDKYAAETSDMPEFVDWMGHDFSMRGQSSIESACASGAGHLLSFKGTDVIPSIDFLEKYYNAEGFTAGSVPASEHSVASSNILALLETCKGDKTQAEKEFLEHLITQKFPQGIVSYVSDTFDYWGLLQNVLPQLKETIMKRNGKLTCRPDSGDPVKIICGDKEAPEGSIERKGSIEHLWDVFGGTVNSKGYKQLDPHIGLIYGDSITFDRCKEICKQLKEKGFASTNLVLGIGSFTYQYVTRDTFGFAMKATYTVINGKPLDIYKDPKTDSGGVKKSARGLLRVNEDFSLSEQVSPEEEKTGLLHTVFYNGVMLNQTSLSEIRKRLNGT